SIATWVAGRHSEWAEPLGTDLLENERVSVSGPDEFERNAQLLAQLAVEPTLQSKLATMLRDSGSSSPSQRKLVLRAMALAPLKNLPATWAPVLVRCLSI